MTPPLHFPSADADFFQTPAPSKCLRVEYRRWRLAMLTDPIVFLNVSPPSSLLLSPGLEDDRPQPPHERPDAPEPDPPGPAVPPPVPVGPRARSGLHHVRGHPGEQLPGHRQLQENSQAASGSQGVCLSFHILQPTANQVQLSHLSCCSGGVSVTL